MALPKIQQPLFELTVPSTNKKVKYRPFTVKEEKILLIAQESKDTDQIILAIKQIINNCIEGINVDKLAMFDMEYILINLRAKSVGNEIEFKIKDPETEEIIELVLDTDNIKMIKDKNHSNVIKISDDISLVMRYPRIDQLSLIAKTEEGKRNEMLFDLMIGCIESIVEGEEVYNLVDFTKEEVNEFVNSLSTAHISDMKKFFDTMPVLKYETKYTRADGTEKTFIAQGTETFFI